MLDSRTAIIVITYSYIGLCIKVEILTVIIKCFLLVKDTIIDIYCYFSINKFIDQRKMVYYNSVCNNQKSFIVKKATL